MTTVGPVAAEMGAAVPSAAKPEAAAAPPTPEPEPDRPAPFLLLAGAVKAEALPWLNTHSIQSLKIPHPSQYTGA
ncbi:MAG: hypothetical protein WBP81_31915 [Solirubrobacteraceae bacterium]